MPSTTSSGTELRRRTLLLGGTLVMAGVQAACSTAPEPDPSDSGITDSPGPTTESGTSTRGGRARVLVVYYSRAGENYYYGDRIDLEVGNTEVLGGIISSRLDELGVVHDVHRLEAADPYPDDYDATVDRNSAEQDADSRPELANQLDSIGTYDVVLVGSPVWNVRPPMLMHTFAEAHDFTDRTVHPFVTYAVSGMGTAEDEYLTACPGAEIGAGLAVRGESVREDGPAAAARWLDGMDLPGRRA